MTDVSEAANWMQLSAVGPLSTATWPTPNFTGVILGTTGTLSAAADPRATTTNCCFCAGAQPAVGTTMLSCVVVAAIGVIESKPTMTMLPVGKWLKLAPKMTAGCPCTNWLGRIESTLTVPAESTVIVAVSTATPDVAVISVRPGLRPWTMPLSVTVATLVALLVQVIGALGITTPLASTTLAVACSTPPISTSAVGNEKKTPAAVVVGCVTDFSVHAATSTRAQRAPSVSARRYGPSTRSSSPRGRPPRSGDTPRGAKQPSERLRARGRRVVA